MNSRPPAAAAGRFTFPGTSISVNRMGYGAMQLAGPHVFGEPRDLDEARAVLREALALGVDHIDTSDYYGPRVTNRLSREALHPYPEGLTLVTKVGAWRDEKGGWILERSADFLRKSVEDNLERLGLDRMRIVNLRMGGPEDDIAAPMRAMRRMQDEGLIAHIGVSTVSATQLQVARDIAPVTLPDFLSNLGLTAFVKSLLAEIGSNEGRVVEKPHVLITRKKNTRQHNDYYQRIRAEAGLLDAPFKLFETVIPEAAAWPNALAMIEEYPTFSQKYPPPLGNILSDLADEIDGAFRDSRNRRF